MTPESLAALADLRRGGHFEWHVVNALALVLYVYASAARRKQWSRVALGIGFLAVELMWEMVNGLVLHFSQRAALWMVGGHSAYLLYVGLNVEIALMFAVAPLVLFQLVTERHRYKVAVGLGVFCVFVEVLLNRVGALVWTWPFWRWPNVALILVVYCGPFAALVWVHDRVSLRNQVRGAAVAVGLAAALHLVLATHLGWV